MAENKTGLDPEPRASDSWNAPLRRFFEKAPPEPETSRMLGVMERRSLARGLALAILSAALAILLQAHGFGAAGAGAVSSIFLPGVILSALVGGPIAGASAAVIAALAVLLRLAPPTRAGDWAALAIFLASCAMIVGVTEAFHRASARARRFAREAEAVWASRRSEQFVRSVLDSLPQEIAVLDERGVILSVNRAWRVFASQNAASPESVGPGIDYIDVLRVAARSDPRAREALQGLEALRAGTSDVFEMEYPCDGPEGPRWFVVYASRGLPGSGLIVCHIDVTKQKRAEEALRESEQKLRAVLGATGDAIIASDETGRIESVNPAALRLFGYEERELLGRNVAMLMAEPYRSAHDGYIGDYLRTGRSAVMGVGREAEALRRDGTVFPVELSLREAAREGPRLFVGMMRDITERKRAEARQRELMEELERSEREAQQGQALFRSILEGAPEGIVLTDTRRTIVVANAAITRMFGYEAGELAGSPISRLYADERQETSPCSASAEPRIIRCRRESGDVFPAQIIMAPYRDGERTLGAIGMIRDVTLELRREEELREAQRLDALGRLTGGIAHDFNNLLTVISGNLHLLGAKLQDDRLTRHLRECERAIAMGARLNQRLMTFARQRRLAPCATNLNEQTTDMLQLLRRTIGENITIRTTLASDLWPTLADPSEIENAILNLAINARDAMPDGGSLSIETSNLTVARAGEPGCEELAPGDYVRLRVGDTGAGMAPEVAARAFEPFFTTKEPGKGTGLGLASIYGFVKQSGGHVTIDSEAGRGTSVTIYLPKLEGERAASAPPEPAAPTARGGRSILVVEDDPEVRRLAVERLEALGYHVLEAEDARSALAVLEGGAAVDLVFADIMMPGGVSGLELAREIARRWPSKPILLTSGFAGPGGKGESLGFPLLRKPYSQGELGRSIQAALAAPRATSPTEA
ncbi:MAG TPA: PAS domain S-box protein [Methylosinus sp.]